MTAVPPREWGGWAVYDGRGTLWPETLARSRNGSQARAEGDCWEDRWARLSKVRGLTVRRVIVTPEEQ